MTKWGNGGNAARHREKTDDSAQLAACPVGTTLSGGFAGSRRKAKYSGVKGASHPV
jgi:hypothetical protein